MAHGEQGRHDERRPWAAQAFILVRLSEMQVPHIDYSKGRMYSRQVPSRFGARQISGPMLLKAGKEQELVEIMIVIVLLGIVVFGP